MATTSEDIFDEYPLKKWVRSALLPQIERENAFVASVQVSISIFNFQFSLSF